MKLKYNEHNHTTNIQINDSYDKTEISYADNSNYKDDK